MVDIVAYPLDEAEIAILFEVQETHEPTLSENWKIVRNIDETKSRNE